MEPIVKFHGQWIGYGLNDTGVEVTKIQHRLTKAYNTHSHAIARGVWESGIYDQATADSVAELSAYLNATEAAKGVVYQTTGVADLAFRTRIGAYVPPTPPGHKYPLQGVSYDTTAYLMPPTAHSFNKATAQGADEGKRLFDTIGGPVIGLGYSMGAKTLRDFEMRLSPHDQQRYIGSFNFGDPSMRPEGSLLGDAPGWGISEEFHPDWVANRYWSYSLDGDWYPRARGLLFFLYRVIARAELTLDFAQYLFTQFPLEAMQELMGTKASGDTTGAAGILSGLAGLMTTGPTNVVGALLNPLQLLTMLPQLIELLTDALKFAITNAHGMYGDPAHAVFDGLTGVDHCVRTIRQIAPGGATLLLFPGSWATWDQGFQADVGRILYENN
jgi:hypothetical protein